MSQKLFCMFFKEVYSFKEISSFASYGKMKFSYKGSFLKKRDKISRFIILLFQLEFCSDCDMGGIVAWL